MSSSTNKKASEYVSKLRDSLKIALPEVVIDSISSSISMDDIEETVYTIKGKGFSPILIRTSSIEDALERGGPDGALKYIAKKISLATRK
jgi:hypothetical protein